MGEHIDDDVALAHGGAQDAFALGHIYLHIFQSGGEPTQSLMAQAKQRERHPAGAVVGAAAQFGKHSLDWRRHFQPDQG